MKGVGRMPAGNIVLPCSSLMTATTLILEIYGSQSMTKMSLQLLAS